MWQIHYSNHECLLIVFQNLKDGQSALFHVVMKGQRHIDLVEKMLEQGANPNIQDAVSMIISITYSHILKHIHCVCLHGSTVVQIS